MHNMGPIFFVLQGYYTIYRNKEYDTMTVYIFYIVVMYIDCRRTLSILDLLHSAYITWRSYRNSVEEFKNDQ